MLRCSGARRGASAINHLVTSREALLETARHIAETEGLSAVSIRRVARDCGVAVGTIYNYFPAKGDLVVALLEDFWREVFHADVCGAEPPQDFLSLCEAIYQRLTQNLGRFTGGFLRQAAALDESTRQKALASQAHYHAHIRDGLRRALEQDTTLPPDLWSDGLTPAGLADFALANILGAARENPARFALLQSLLRRLFDSPPL